MPTTGPFAGRLAEVGLANAAWTVGTTVSGMTFNDIERVRNPRMPQSTKYAETSSNDSSGHEENIATWITGSFSFEMVRDFAATYQNALEAHAIATQMIGVRYRPTGNVSGDYQYFFAAIIENIEPASDSNDASRMTVTLKRASAVTRSTI